MRQGPAQRLDVARPELVRREDLHKVRAGLVRGLRFGGCIGAQHDRTPGGMRDGHQFRPANGRDDELRARLNGRAAGVRRDHGADAGQGALADLLARFADGAQGVGGGHGDLDRVKAPGDERLEQRPHLGGLLRADNGDNAGIGEEGDDFHFSSHSLFPLGADCALRASSSLSSPGCIRKRRSPSPRPSPLGRGSHVVRLSVNSSASTLPTNRRGISLSLRERVGVRGKRAPAVPGSHPLRDAYKE